MEEEKQEFEVVVNATKSQIEEFKESILWEDICREIDSWVEGFEREESSIVDRIAIENLSTGAALTLLGSIDGRKKSAEFFKDILDMFLSVLEDKKDDKQTEKLDQSEV